jgi:hypothetical protein
LWNTDSKVLTLCGDVWDYSNTTRKHFYRFLKDYTGFQAVASRAQFLKLLKNPEQHGIKLTFGVVV